MTWRIVLQRSIDNKSWASMKKDRKLVMADMRRLARLLIAFREASNDSKLRGEDMLEQSRFTQLEEALTSVFSKFK